jgi:S1-C subfamily serine protease
MSDQAPWRRALQEALDDAQGGASHPGPRFDSPEFGAVQPHEERDDASRPWLSRRATAALFVVALAVAGSAGAGAGWIAGGVSADPAADGIESRRARHTAALLARVRPGIVSISATVPRGIGSSTSAGSGILLTSDGEVLTNAHVVRSATAIRVVVAGRPEPMDAELVALDPAVDLALLRIPGARGLPTARLGRSAEIRVGDEVFAIGNALGLDGEPTVTRGIVSALDRSIDTEGGRLSGLLQTDAAISSGNSGGALVDRRGDVIGVNTAVLTNRGGAAIEGIAFAVPIDTARRTLEVLRGG